MLRVLSLTFKPFLQQIRLLQVASILTSDWIRLPGSQEIYDRSYITCCKRSLLGPVKHEACRDANFNYSLLSATTFCNLQQPDLLQDRFDSWVVKCATSLFNFLFNNVAKQVAHFQPVLPYLDRNQCCNLFKRASKRAHKIGMSFMCLRGQCIVVILINNVCNTHLKMQFKFAQYKINIK